MNIETANILLQYRKKSGLSQEELASKIGVSRQAVSKWERAEASPDTDNLILLAKVYGVTLDELLTGDPEEILNRNKQDLEDNKTEENTQTDTGKETENNDTNEETKAKATVNTCAVVPTPPLKTAAPQPIRTKTMVPIISEMYFFIFIIM